MIEIALKKRLDDFHLDVAMTLPFDGICGLIGASGSGKSSLFAMLAGHSTPDHGHIRIAGQTLLDTDTGVNMTPARRGIGLVFQDGLLFPHMTVRRNLTYGAARGDDAMLGRLSATLELEPLLHRRPARLSGGERQRVAIARALMARPRLLLLDEPVSALDPDMRAEVLALLEQVHIRLGTPMIYISHAPEEIRRLATRVVTLENGHVADLSRRPSPVLRPPAEPPLTPGPRPAAFC